MNLPFRQMQPRLTVLAGRVHTDKPFPDDREICIPMWEAVRRARYFDMTKFIFSADAGYRPVRSALVF